MDTSIMPFDPSTAQPIGQPGTPQTVPATLPAGLQNIPNTPFATVSMDDFRKMNPEQQDRVLNSIRKVNSGLDKDNTGMKADIAGDDSFNKQEEQFNSSIQPQVDALHS